MKKMQKNKLGPISLGHSIFDWNFNQNAIEKAISYIYTYTMDMID